MKQFNTIALFLLLLTTLFSCNLSRENNTSDLQPNILWITCEDITTMQGSYGDPIANTPNLDKLANEGIQFNHAYSTAAVCSPARSCLVTGVYATSLGTQNLRSEFAIPSEIRTLPHILRENDYYCTNNYKEDYNFTDPTIWDESSKTAHWRNRADNQPFFSVFNFETTHQSQIFGDDEAFFNKYGKLLSDSERNTAESMQLAPYYFESSEVRKLWARYYDLVTIMDRQVADVLKQLEQDGLAENTIVFYFSDHGTGMPRAKRALYNSGVQVPFIVHVPERLKSLMKTSEEQLSESIVSFVDFPPTVLSLVGMDKPSYMQGSSFLAQEDETSAKYAFATSDRVDEAFELSRTVKGKRYSYIRNFLPHLPLIQPNFYSDQSEIMKELYRLKDSIGFDGMTEAQQSMWLPKRHPEELYDLASDPHEVNNLAGDLAHNNILLEMRGALKEWMIKTHDTGLVPEGYLLEKTKSKTAFEVAQDPAIYPIEEILSLNDLILGPEINDLQLAEMLSHDHELIRYWAAVSLQYVKSPRQAAIEKLRRALNDASLLVRLAVSEALCAFNMCDEDAQKVILDGLHADNEAEMLYAARIFELNKASASIIMEDAQKFHQEICQRSDGKWKGYDLYSCWAMNEAFKEEN